VISKPPDGYTIGISSGAVTIAYHMGKLNFNPLTDTTNIIRYTTYVFGMVVRDDAPWKTMQEFVKYAKENPGKVTYGTPGVGTNPHLAMEELSILTGIQLVHMPFKGGAESNTALLGGHIDAISDSTSWGPLVDAGKFRLLVTYAPQRMPRYPQVPTLKEAGYDMVYSSPLQIIGPKGMPKPVVAKLHDAFKKSLNDPDYLSILKNFPVREGVRLQLRCEYLNAFNHAQFSDPERNPTNSNFGRITSQTNLARNVQIAAQPRFKPGRREFKRLLLCRRIAFCNIQAQLGSAQLHVAL
jgi:tripartite-type tricarboxylate transporter receptor subunit TctC